MTEPPSFVLVASASVIAQAALFERNFSKLGLGKPIIVMTDRAANRLQYDGVFTQSELIFADEIVGEHIDDMSLRYNEGELACALKPFAMEYVLNKSKSDVVFYIDSDVIFLRGAARLASLMPDDAAVLLSPHRLDGESPSIEFDLTMLLWGGPYNAGLLGVRRRDESFRFLRWWQERCRTHSYSDLRFGGSRDQKWLALAPAYFVGVRVLGDPGVNIAYWNYSSRRNLISSDLGCFFHASRFDKKITLYEYIETYIKSSNDELIDLLQHYQTDRANIESYLWSSDRTIKYGLGFLKDGTIIPDTIREIYREKAPEPNASAAAWLSDAGSLMDGVQVLQAVGPDVYSARDAILDMCLSKLKKSPTALESLAREHDPFFDGQFVRQLEIRRANFERPLGRS